MSKINKLYIKKTQRKSVDGEKLISVVADTSQFKNFTQLLWIRQ